MKSQRLGIFYVHNRFFEDLSGGKGLNLFHGMIILRAEVDWSRDYTKYLAHHEHFEEITPYHVYPEYEPVFAEEPDGYGYNYGIPKWVKKQ